MTIVSRHSRSKGTARLVALAIANHDGDGGAWPSIATLMVYANTSEATVHRAIRILEDLGEIRRHIQAGGTRDMDDQRRPNRYDLLLTCPPGCDRTKNHNVRPVVEADADPDALIEVVRPDSGVSHMTPQVIHRGVTGDTGGGVTGDTQTILKKPVKRSPAYLRLQEAPEIAACGHRLVDDRHCTHGCRVPDGAVP